MNKNDHHDTTEARLQACELAVMALVNEVAERTQRPDRSWIEIRNRAIAELVDLTAELPTASTPAEIDACELCGHPIEGRDAHIIAEGGQSRRWHRGCV